MSTPYSDIYSSFINKITDYAYVEIIDQDILESLFLSFLKDAIAEFSECTIDLTARDDTMGEFDEDLSGLEIKILATLMIKEWIKPSLYTTSLLKQSLSNKDYQIYSQINHLDGVKKLYEAIDEEITGMIYKYIINQNDYSDLV